MPRPAKYDDTELLDRSYDLLWRHGCDAVSIRDLERVLDLKAPSIYRRFHSRDGLVACSVDRYVERVVAARVRRHLARADDPVAGLRSFFLSALDPASGEARPRGCLLTLTAGQSAADAPEVRAAVDAGLSAVEAALEIQVGRAVDRGCTGPGADVASITTVLLLAFEGLLVLVRTGRSDLGPAVDQLLASCFPSASVHSDPTTSPERTTDHE